MISKSQIIEVGFEVRSQDEWDFLESFFSKIGIPFYVEPLNKFNSLEDLECQCEGK